MNLIVDEIVPYNKGVSFCDDDDNFYCWLTENRQSPIFYYYYNDKVEVVFDKKEIKDGVIYIDNLKVVGEDI